jgi:hypothetical protein
MSDIKCPLLKTEICKQTVVKLLKQKFIKICSAVLRLFHTYGPTDVENLIDVLRQKWNYQFSPEDYRLLEYGIAQFGGTCWLHIPSSRRRQQVAPKR